MSGSNNTSVKVTADASGYTAELTKAAKSAAAFSAAQDAASKRVQVAQAAIAEAAANGSNAHAKAINNFVSQLARAAEASGKTQAQVLAQKAAMLGVSESVTGYVAKIEAASLETHGFSLATGAARRELAVLAHEAGTGNWTKFGGSLGVLAERTGAINLLFSATGASLLVAAAAAGGFFYEIAKGVISYDALANAAAFANGYLGLTNGELSDMSKALAGTATPITSIQAAMTALVGSGKIAADQLSLATKVTAEFAHDTGEAVDKVAERMVKFSEDPQKALEELQGQYHTFSAAQVDVIENYIKTGDKASAYKTILQGMDEAHEKFKTNAEKNIGVIQKAWDLLKADVIDTINHISQIGVATSDAEKYASAVQRQAKAVQNLRQAQNMPFGNTSSAQQELDAANAQLAAMQGIQDRAKASALADAQRASQGDASVRTNKYLSDPKYATPGDKHKLDLTKENEDFATATANLDRGSRLYQDALKRHYSNIQEINEQYAKKTKPKAGNEGAMNALLADLQGKNKLIEAEEKRSLTTLKSQRDAGILDQTEYLQQVHDIQAKALDGEIANSQKRADIAKGKKEQTAFANANTETEKLVAQRQALDQSLTESLSVLAAQRSSDLAKFGQAEADTLRRQMEDRQQYYATLFMSPEMKVQADAAYQLMRQFQEKAAALQKQYDDPKADQAVYQAKRADLKTYYEAQLADLQQSQAMQMAVRNSYSDQIRLAMVSMAGTTKTNAELAATAFSTSFNDMQNALETFVTTGKFSFSSFASSVLSDLAKIALKAAESQIFNSILGGTSFFSAGGSVGHFATGGSLSGPGTGTSDSIPIMASNGEYIVRASQAKKYGSLLESINNGHMAHFATGGAVGSVASTSAGPASYPVSLTLQNNGSNPGITNEDLMYLGPLIQNLIDKRMAQKMGRQGGYAYKIQHRQI